MAHIRVSFRLEGRDAEITRQLREHVRADLGSDIGIGEIVRRQYITWLRSVAKEVPDGEHAEATQIEAVSELDTAESVPSSAGDTLLTQPEESADRA